MFFSQSGNAGDGFKRQMCPAVMLAPVQQERGSGQGWKRDRISEARRACFQPLQDIFLIRSPIPTHSYEPHEHKAASVFILGRPVPLRNVCTIYMSYKL